MNKYKGLLLILVGFIVAVPVFLASHYAMVKTSTPGFCSSCHEIEPAYLEWKSSSHANNARGVVAECKDCHLPPQDQLLKFAYGKAYHGIKDVVGHLIGGKYDRVANRKSASEGMDNNNCLTCHGNILFIPGKRGAMLAHKSVLYPRPGYEKRCTECHENLVHNPSPLFRYKDI